MLHKSPQYCNDKRQGIQARISLLNAYESNGERKIAFGGTLTVSSRGSPQRISANEQTINPPRKIKRKREKEGKREGESERREGKGGKREMRKISSVAQCDSLQTRSRSFSLSLLRRASQTHTCSRAVCQSKIVSAIKLNFLHPLPSTRWERGRSSGREKNLTGFSALEVRARSDHGVTSTLRYLFL